MDVDPKKDDQMLEEPSNTEFFIQKRNEEPLKLSGKPDFQLKN